MQTEGRQADAAHVEQTGAEARFGQAVRQARQDVRMSQKDLASAMNKLGVSIDGPAISRLEKGSRIIRLNEAVALAEALDTSLEDLVNQGNPVALLSEMRRSSDGAMNDLYWTAVRWVDQLMEIQSLLSEKPELLHHLRDRQFGPPETAADYLSWVHRRVTRVAAEDKLGGVGIEAEADLAAFTEILTTHVASVVHLYEGDDEEMPVDEEIGVVHPSRLPALDQDLDDEPEA